MNQSILIDPQGQVLWTYNKARPVPGLDNLVPGDGVVPMVNTPYGRISNVICFDGDEPPQRTQALIAVQSREYSGVSLEVSAAVWSSGDLEHGGRRRREEP